jgi:hypothetical protein
MNWYTLLKNGWSLDRDEVTGLYSYGTIPRAVFDSYTLVKSIISRKAYPRIRRACGVIPKGWKTLRRSHPYVAYAITSAAAVVGYFVTMGIAWSFAFKILKWIKVF